MFYEPKYGSGLPDDPLNAIIIPRPIGWISTLSEDGIPNLAPYSFFNAVAYAHPQVMFAATGRHKFGGYKDAVNDAQTTGEFIVNLAIWELREQMNASSASVPHNVDEFEYTGLSKEPGYMVKCPRVAESPIHLECRYTRSVTLPSNGEDKTNTVVFGEVIGVNIDDAYLNKDGRIDFTRLSPVGRLGYLDFTKVDNFFPMERP